MAVRAAGPSLRRPGESIMPPASSAPSDLTGRVALVTGGAVGIGRASALALARAGAAVGVHYNLSRSEAEETADLVRRSGGTAFLLHADLTDEAQASGVVDRLLAQAGRLDVLFNNAGSPLS